MARRLHVALPSYHALLLGGLLGLFLSGCHRDHVSNGATYIVIAGTWSGTYQIAGGATHPISFTLSQTANVVTGPYQMDSGLHSGTVQGSVDGNNATLTLTPASGCTGSFTVNTGVQAGSMQIFMNGHDCHSTIANATGSLTKT